MLDLAQLNEALDTCRSDEDQLIYIEAYAAYLVEEEARKKRKKEYGPEPWDDPRQLWLPFQVDNSTGGKGHGREGSGGSKGPGGEAGDDG